MRNDNNYLMYIYLQEYRKGHVPYKYVEKSVIQRIIVELFPGTSRNNGKRQKRAKKV
jgi:hypothetical protein